MADIKIGSMPTTASRFESSDVGIGNAIEHPGVTSNIPGSALRRSDGNYDIESISNLVRILTGGSAKVTIAQNGDVVITTGDLTISSGDLITSIGHLLLSIGDVRLVNGGVDFSGIGTAAKILNDYEEGTFTLIDAFNGGDGTAVISASTANYIKIGDLVTVFFEFTVTKNTDSGNVRFDSLPFAGGASSAYSVCHLEWDNVTLAGGAKFNFRRTAGTSARLHLYYTLADSSATAAPVTAAALGATARFAGSFSYTTF
jgi:hypothetical protein